MRWNIKYGFAFYHSFHALNVDDPLRLLSPTRFAQTHSTVSRPQLKVQEALRKKQKFQREHEEVSSSRPNSNGINSKDLFLAIFTIFTRTRIFLLNNSQYFALRALFVVVKNVSQPRQRSTFVLCCEWWCAHPEMYYSVPILLIFNKLPTIPAHLDPTNRATDRRDER